jgi:hypothetical protein
MKMFSILIFAFIAISLASCVYTAPYMVTDNPIGTKVGKSIGTCYDFLGIFSLLGNHAMCFNADFSIHTAAKNGGINKIATVDIKRTSVLGIVITYETTVTGE